MRGMLGFLLVVFLLGCDQGEQATLLELPAMQVDGTVKEVPPGAVVLEVEEGTAMLPLELVEDQELVLDSRLSAELPAGRAELLVLNSDSALFRRDDGLVQIPVSLLRSQRLEDRPVRLVDPAGEVAERTLAQALAAAVQDQAVFVSPAVRDLDTLAFRNAVPVRVVDRDLVVALREDRPELVLLPDSGLVGTQRAPAPGSLLMAVNQPEGIRLLDWRPGMFALAPTRLEGRVVEDWNETLLLEVEDEMLLIPSRLAGDTEVVLGSELALDVPASVAVPLSIASQVLTLQLQPLDTLDRRLVVQLPPEAVSNPDTVYLSLQDPQQVLTLAQALDRSRDSGETLLTFNLDENPDVLVYEMPADQTVGSLLGFHGDQAVFLTADDSLHVIPAGVARSKAPEPGRPVVFSPGRSGKTIVSFTPGHRNRELRGNLAEDRNQQAREAQKGRAEQAREVRKSRAEQAREAQKGRAEQAREVRKGRAEQARGEGERGRGNGRG